MNIPQLIKIAFTRGAPLAPSRAFHSGMPWEASWVPLEARTLFRQWPPAT